MPEYTGWQHHSNTCFAVLFIGIAVLQAYAEKGLHLGPSSDPNHQVKEIEVHQSGFNDQQLTKLTPIKNVLQREHNNCNQ